MLYQTRHVNLRGRHYPSSDTSPSQILVDTRCPEDKRQPRYPLAECHFPDARLQPYVHSCLVKIREGHRVHYFTFFYKNHIRLATNISVGHIDRPYPFRSDVIVMRCAARDHRSFVNMRGRDSALSDVAVRRLVFGIAVRGLLTYLVGSRSSSVLFLITER